MNQDQPELTLEESIKQVMQTLPPIIRDYLTQGRYTLVARNLMAKYGLRIDQGGVLEREIMLLLMGIENPDEFSKALAEEAKLDQKTVNGIVEDINEQIFIPLREEMRKGPLAEVKPLQVPVAQPPRHQNVALRDALATITKKAPQPVESEKLLEDHEEPHIEFNKPPAVPSIVVPLPPPSAPNRVPSLATANSQQPTPLNNPPGGLSGEHSVKQNVLAAKPYSIDPYREPFDEK
jgi:hypothetical protein